MEKEAFDFFQDHSRNYLEMALKTDKQERMHRPDGYGKRTGVCGDTVEFFICVKHDTIQEVSFLVDGCINTVACCNTVARLVEGRHVCDAWDIQPDTVIKYLETLPPEHAHCAELSAGALYLALSNFQENQRGSCKKFYSIGP